MYRGSRTCLSDTKKRIVTIVTNLLIVVSLSCIPFARAQTTRPLDFDHNDPLDSLAVEQRVETLLNQMTLPEEIRLVGGSGMSIAGIPRLGIEPVQMSDGSQGVRGVEPSTAYPAGLMLAATWDKTLAEEEGRHLGRDARARGIGILLGPGINLYRAPMAGRNFEYFGEDPYLVSRMAVNYIRGVQSEGVMATVKHYVANNSEFDRFNTDSKIDERTLQEIYLPAFEAAVKDGHVAAVMVAHNLVNGQHMSQNYYLDTEVLKKEWGFDGILMPDWNATYDGVSAANAGLDLEMPHAKAMNEATLLPAVRDSRVAKSVIDDKVRRILRREVEYQLLDEKRPPNLSIPLYDETDRKVALRVAEEGMVLLKNQKDLLPLNSKRQSSIAVIGPDAYPAVPSGGGSAHVSGFMPVSFYTGLSDYLGLKSTVTWNEGVRFPAEIFDQTQFTDETGRQASGLKGEYFSTADLTGAPVVNRIDEKLDFEWCDPRHGKCPGFAPASARWEGFYRPKATGLHSFVSVLQGNSSVHVYLDGKDVYERHGMGVYEPHLKSVFLDAAHVYHITVEYKRGSWLSGGGKTPFGFGIIANKDIVDSRAVALARHADTVILCLGFNDYLEREALDRTSDLPFGQEQLIREIVKANPRTVVVLTNGGAVDMHTWADNVPAIIEAWYSGQEAGHALARVLFGDVNPSGKLPITFDRSWTESPVHDSYYPQGEAQVVDYKEDGFLGYRYYDQADVKPQYPFGYGLSYTAFKFSRLKVTPADSAINQRIQVALDVTNSGSRDGDEIVQIYVGDRSARVSRPFKELKAFARVSLQAHQSKHVVLRLDRRAFADYDALTNKWMVDPGRYIIFAGDSAAHVPLQKVVRFRSAKASASQDGN